MLPITVMGVVYRGLNDVILESLLHPPLIWFAALQCLLMYLSAPC